LKVDEKKKVFLETVSLGAQVGFKPQSSYLSLLSSGIIDVHHHTRVRKILTTLSHFSV
jgi:hypothetical protein